MQESTHKVPNSASQAVLSRVAAHPSRDSPITSRRFALGASNVCLVAKTFRAPSRYCRDTRVYGHTTTAAMHDMSTPPPLFFLAGPYTCIRTVGNRSVAMLPFHLARLWESACATGLGSAARLEGRQSLGRRTTEAITKAARAFVLGEACCAAGVGCHTARDPSIAAKEHGERKALSRV